MNNKALIAIAGGLAAALLLATPGCKEDSSGGGNATPSGGGSRAKTYVIGVIAKAESNPVFQAARTGAQDAAKELADEYNADIRIDWRTPPNEDAQKQAEYLEALVSQGVDGIAISCSDANLLTSAINDAVARGIEVVTFDSDAADSDRFAYFGVDDQEAGKVVMQNLAEQMGGTGKVAILAGNQAAPNLQARVKGVLDELRNHPGIDPDAETYYHPETATDAAATIARVQTNNPDITGWALVGGWPLYTDNALDGIHETAKVVSMDPLPLPLEYVKKGEVQVLVGQPYYGWGYESVRLLLDKLAKGKDPESAMNFAKFTTITKDNVNAFEGNWDKWLGKK